MHSRVMMTSEPRAVRGIESSEVVDGDFDALDASLQAICVVSRAGGLVEPLGGSPYALHAEMDSVTFHRR